MFIELTSNPALPEIELVLPDRPFVQGDGLQAVALVKEPAIGVEFIMFSAEEVGKQEVLVHFDEAKGIVTGPLLIPGLRVKRNNKPQEYPNGYNVFLSANTIEKTMQLFFSQGKNISLNIMHDPRLRPNGVIYESWIKADPELDKSNIHFSAIKDKLPVGTAFISVQLQDDATKKLVKQGLLAGFSIEGLFVRGDDAPDKTQPKTAMSAQKKSKFAELVKWAAEALGIESDDSATATTITLKDVNGQDVTIATDAKGQIHGKGADGKDICLQVEVPATAAKEGASDNTNPVKNPIEETAMAAVMEKVNAKFKEQEAIIVKLTARVENQAAIIAEVEGTPASDAAKSGLKPGKKPESIREKFGKTVEDKPESTNDAIERIEAERKANKAAAK